MIGIIRMLFVVLVVFGAIGFILFQAIKFLGLTKWSKSRRNWERREGQRKAKYLLDNPVVWSVKEFDLLALPFAYETKRRLFSIENTGLFKTIYGEPFISFVLKKYSSKGYILCFSTSDDNYTVIRSANESIVYLGEDEVGRYANGKILDVQGKVWGRVTPGNLFDTVSIRDIEVAHMESSSENTNENTRLFQLVEDSKITRDQIVPFTVLIIMHQIEPVLFV